MTLIERLRAHGSRSNHEPTYLELEAADALDRVLKLHQPRVGYCVTCGGMYPCLTAQAVTA